MDENQIIQVEEKGNYTILHLYGKFVSEDEANILKSYLQKYAEQANNRVILDFTYVLYFSSISLGIIAKEDEQYTLNKGKLVICNVPEILKSIFVLTKLSSILNLFDTLEEAEEEILK
jgi:anti-sigma B factor antagonist